MPEPSIQLAILLLIGGLVMLVLELFLPSAGILFASAMVCIVSSVVVAVFVNPLFGLAMILVDLVLAFTLPSIGLSIWKRTPIGRRMFLDDPVEQKSSEELPPSDISTDGFDYLSLMGETGKTLTPLRPAGTTDFDGRRVDTVSEGVMIDRGELVRVVAVEGHRVVVRRLEDD